MKNYRLFWVFLIASVGLFFAKSSLAQLPPVGAQIVGNLSIGSDYRPYNISLPPGTWQVAFINYQDTEKFYYAAYIGPAGFEQKAYGDVALIQIADRQLIGLISVKARLKTSSFIRVPSICNEPTRPNHINTYGKTAPQISKCLEVKPLDWNSQRQSDLMAGVKDYLGRINVSYPVDMVGLQFYEDYRTQRFLDFSYYVNPAIWGYANTSSTVDRSPWNSALITRDPTKASFMTALVAYAEAYSSVLSNSARDGGSGAGFVAFNPPANAAQRGAGNSQTQSAQPAPGPEAKLKQIQQTCVTIGFKPGTPGMFDCVKELSIR